MQGMLGGGSCVGQSGGGSEEGLTSQNWGGGAPEYGAGVLFVKDEAHVLEDVVGSSGLELACGRSYRFGKFAPYFVGLGSPRPPHAWAIIGMNCMPSASQAALVLR